MKFFCALLIMMIHASPFGKAEQFTVPNFLVQHYLARVAVPFFFIATGFFLYRGASPENFDLTPTLRTLKKFLRLYVLWGILYFPIKLERILAAPNGIVYASVSCLRDYLFVGSFDHLWYLNASMVGIAMVSFLLKKRMKPGFILALGFLLNLIGLLAQNWIGLIRPLETQLPLFWKVLHLSKKVFVTTRNGIFEGFFYIGIGMAYRVYRLSLKRKTAVWGLLVSLLLMFAECAATTDFGYSKVYDMYLFAAPTAFFLFALAERAALPDSPAYPTLRALSALLFYIHPMFMYLADRFAQARGLDIESNPTRFLMVLSGSLLLSLLIRRLSRAEKLRWLKNLYA